MKSPQYVAVIGDMVGSSALNRSARAKTQISFTQLVDQLNADFQLSLQGRFVIALGDGFEGLIHARAASAIVPILIWKIELTFTDLPIRLGFGFGGIDTALTANVSNLDGPTFHRAREAVEAAAKSGKMGGVFRGFGENHDAVLNGIARILHAHRSRWSRQQRNVAMLLHQGHRQSDVARIMSRSRQAVSTDARAANWAAYVEGEQGLTKALENAIAARPRWDTMPLRKTGST